MNVTITIPVTYYSAKHDRIILDLHLSKKVIADCVPPIGSSIVIGCFCDWGIEFPKVDHVCFDMDFYHDDATHEKAQIEVCTTTINTDEPTVDSMCRDYGWGEGS